MNSTKSKKPIISMVAAMAENRVIGLNGAVPWHIPADLRRFRELTMGRPLIMGRRTFESIGRVLPGRTTIVLTRQQGYVAEGCLVAHDPEEALTLTAAAEEVFVCGGGEVYREMLPLAHRVLLTVVHAAYEGDTRFPELPADFMEIGRVDISDDPPYSFVTYQRKG